MERIVIKLTRQVKRNFRRTIKKIKDAKLKTRYLIILHTAEGYSRRKIAEMLLCSASTVDRVRKRFGDEGELGLIDRRGDKGLGISCLALKIAYTINAIDQFTSHQIEQWADYIKSFQIGEHRRFAGIA